MAFPPDAGSTEVAELTSDIHTAAVAAHHMAAITSHSSAAETAQLGALKVALDQPQPAEHTTSTMNEAICTRIVSEAHA